LIKWRKRNAKVCINSAYAQRFIVEKEEEEEEEGKG
jgi:hypothetical protein